jgi:hypothetical protein
VHIACSATFRRVLHSTAMLIFYSTLRTSRSHCSLLGSRYTDRFEHLAGIVVGTDLTCCTPAVHRDQTPPCCISHHPSQCRWRQLPNSVTGADEPCLPITASSDRVGRSSKPSSLPNGETTLGAPLRTSRDCTFSYLALTQLAHSNMTYRIIIPVQAAGRRKRWRWRWRGRGRAPWLRARRIRARSSSNKAGSSEAIQAVAARVLVETGASSVRGSGRVAGSGIHDVFPNL